MRVRDCGDILEVGLAQFQPQLEGSRCVAEERAGRCEMRLRRIHCRCVVAWPESYLVHCGDSRKNVSGPVGMSGDVASGYPEQQTTGDSLDTEGMGRALL